MKKIEDLSRDKNIKINLSPDTRIKKVEVLGEKQEIIQDLTSTDPLKGDIEFLSQKKIFLTEKKKQKSFDALEKKKLPFWKKTLVFSRNKFFIKRVKSEGVFSFSKGKMPQLPHLSKRKYQLLFLLLFLCFL